MLFLFVLFCWLFCGFVCLFAFGVCFVLFWSRGCPCRECLQDTLLHNCSLYRHFHANLRGWICKCHSSHQLGLWLHATLSFSQQYWPAMHLPPTLAPPSPPVHYLGQQYFVQFSKPHPAPSLPEKAFFSAHLTQFLVQRWLCRCPAAGRNEQPGL